MSARDLLYTTDIYAGFDQSQFPEDQVHGWGGHPGFFLQMLLASQNALKQSPLVIEVGSWKGKSAIAMAKSLDRFASPDVEVLCIDTWLGATEFWEKKDDKKRYLALDLKNGYPQVYYHFLANVVRERAMHRIVPFPQTSTNAARFLMRHGVKAGAIYIDGSHEYVDVGDDLNNFYPLLAEGGVIFGDDYCPYWKGVIDAVNEFADIHDLKLSHWTYPNAEGAPSDYWALGKEQVCMVEGT